MTNSSVRNYFPVLGSHQNVKTMVKLVRFHLLRCSHIEICTGSNVVVIAKLVDCQKYSSLFF